MTCYPELKYPNLFYVSVSITSQSKDPGIIFPLTYLVHNKMNIFHALSVVIIYEIIQIHPSLSSTILNVNVHQSTYILPHYTLFLTTITLLIILCSII